MLWVFAKLKSVSKTFHVMMHLLIDHSGSEIQFHFQEVKLNKMLSSVYLYQNLKIAFEQESFG